MLKADEMSWHSALKKITPYVYKILTPQGTGTGSQILYQNNKPFCGIATAYHVIEHSIEWKEPIKITHFESNKTIFLEEKDYIIFPFVKEDLAFILFDKNKFSKIKKDGLKLVEEKMILNQGVETGWCGFPSVSINNLCFFTGHVSCCLKSEASYLIDGVAIHGVSGGPAFYIPGSGGDPTLCGIVSQYIPNWSSGKPLPGVCVVRTVESYHKLLSELKTMDQAKEEAEEIVKKQKEEIAKKREMKPTKEKKESP